jgi:SAM-dependent methyltransferase
MTPVGTGPGDAPFDAYALRYEEALQQGLDLSGESADYFARARVLWLGARLARIAERPASVLDFGCGAGGAVPHLHSLPGVQRVVGVDPSRGLLERAAARFGGPATTFQTLDEFADHERIALAFTNGVFHHIVPDERPAALEFVHRALCPGGLFAFWENNPWNPGTRWVMRRIPFDRDAIPLNAHVARRMLRRAGFEIIATDFLFIFPRVLRWLRPLESSLSSLPFGAQYQILCRRS